MASKIVIGAFLLATVLLSTPCSARMLKQFTPNFQDAVPILHDSDPANDPTFWWATSANWANPNPLGQPGNEASDDNLQPTVPPDAVPSWRIPFLPIWVPFTLDWGKGK
jgi:hypothetical protein